MAMATAVVVVGRLWLVGVEVLAHFLWRPSGRPLILALCLGLDLKIRHHYQPMGR
jgi:hypothetical protein